MGQKRVNVKERVSEEGEIDLSMSDLQDVPVKDIAAFRKVHSLDLSNNHIKTLPANFITLTHIIKLDLSKNLLKELPENFGDLVKLKYLDLYQNQLEFLPLSFSKLRSLKWLDLKDNPLTVAVAKVAGPCLDAKQCQSCARDVVNFFVQVQEQVSNDIETRSKDRQRQLEINQQKQKESKKAKKKEKNKQKQENGVAKETSVKPPAKKDKRSAEKAAPASCKKSRSIFLLFTYLVLFSALMVFILASFEPARRVIGASFNEGVRMLPPNLQIHVLTVGAYVEDFHEKAVNITTNLVHSVANHENVALASITLKRLIENVQNKTREVLKTYT